MSFDPNGSFQHHFVLVRRKEKYYCGDYDIDYTVLTSDNMAEHIKDYAKDAESVKSLKWIELPVEKRVSQQFDASWVVEKTSWYEEDADGTHLIKIDGEDKLRAARLMIDKEYKWVAPRDSDAYIEWISEGEYFEEENIDNFTHGIMTQSRLPDALDIADRPTAIVSRKTLHSSLPFVCFDSLVSLMAFIRDIGEVTIDYYYDDWFHKGFGKGSKTPARVATIIF